MDLALWIIVGWIGISITTAWTLAAVLRANRDGTLVPLRVMVTTRPNHAEPRR